MSSHKRRSGIASPTGVLQFVADFYEEWNLQQPGAAHAASAAGNAA